MADLVKIFKGIGIFFIAYFAVVMLNSIINPYNGNNTLLDTLNTELYTNNDLANIIQMGLVIVYALAIVIAPSYYTITGILEKDEHKAGTKILLAILIFIFSLAITIKAWYAVPILTDITDSTYITALFWIGLIAIWLQITLITPTYLIIDAYKHQNNA